MHDFTPPKVLIDPKMVYNSSLEIDVSRRVKWGPILSNTIISPSIILLIPTMVIAQIVLFLLVQKISSDMKGFLMLYYL